MSKRSIHDDRLFAAFLVQMSKPNIQPFHSQDIIILEGKDSTSTPLSSSQIPLDIVPNSSSSSELGTQPQASFLKMRQKRPRNTYKYISGTSSIHSIPLIDTVSIIPDPRKIKFKNHDLPIPPFERMLLLPAPRKFQNRINHLSKIIYTPSTLEEQSSTRALAALPHRPTSGGPGRIGGDVMQWLFTIPRPLPSQIHKFSIPKLKPLSSTGTEFKKGTRILLDQIREIFFTQVLEDLATFALHADRTRINIHDITLLFQRQGLIPPPISHSFFGSEIEEGQEIRGYIHPNLVALARNYLPKALFSRVVPVATADNEVINM